MPELKYGNTAIHNEKVIGCRRWGAEIMLTHLCADLNTGKDPVFVDVFMTREELEALPAQIEKFLAENPPPTSNSEE